MRHEGRSCPAPGSLHRRVAARYAAHCRSSFLPVGLHRFLSQGDYFRERLELFPSCGRSALLDGTCAGVAARHGVDGGSARSLRARRGEILSQIGGAVHQKYLKSLAVHVLTLPVPRWSRFRTRLLPNHAPGDAARAGWASRWASSRYPSHPICGSLTRGYTCCTWSSRAQPEGLSIALSVGFFKYIGYLSFPSRGLSATPPGAFMAGMVHDACSRPRLRREGGAVGAPGVQPVLHCRSPAARIRERDSVVSLPLRAWQSWHRARSGRVPLSPISRSFNSIRTYGLPELAPAGGAASAWGGVVVAAGRSAPPAVFASSGPCSPARGGGAGGARRHGAGLRLVDGRVVVARVRHMWCLLLFPLLSAIERRGGGGFGVSG